MASDDSKLETGGFVAPLRGLSEVLTQYAQANKQQQKVIEENIKQIREASWLKELGRLFQSLGNGPQLAFDLQKKPEQALSLLRFPIIDWESYLEREAESLAFAASFGWFIQPESDATISKHVEELEGNPEKLDALFTYFIERDMKAVERRLVLHHPEHALFVQEAFKLHRERRYIASVPIFLLVADGLSKAATGKSVFTGKSKGSPQIADWIRLQDFDSWADTFFGVLSKHHALSQHTPGRLNRHKVLHGEDLAYHTKTNSLRAMSFVGFVGWLLAVDGKLLKSLESSS